MSKRKEIEDLLEQRAKALHKVRDIHEKAQGEKRGLTSEEKDEAKRYRDEANSLKDQAEDEKRYLETQAELDELEKEGNRRTSPDDPKNEDRNEPADITATDEYRSFVWDRLLNPTAPVDSENVRHLQEAQNRALSAGSSSSGGYLYMGSKFHNELIRGVRDITFMRRIARVLPTLKNADSLGVPVLKNKMSDAEWTSELTTGTADNALSFGKRELQPHPLNKKARVSKRLIRKVPNSIELVKGFINEAVGETMENAYMTGDGVKKPLGIFTASEDGISTDRDVSEDNTDTAITFDNLKRVKDSLKQQHRDRAAWVFHRDVVTEISILKDDYGRYLLQEAVKMDEPDKILGRPYYESEFAPSSMTANSYVGILGNFRHYWILDADSTSIKRYEELYAESGQDLFMVAMESDGAPVLEEAFARVQLASGS